MCLNHPQNHLPPPAMAKLASTKPVPGAKNVENCCCNYKIENGSREWMQSKFWNVINLHLQCIRKAKAWMRQPVEILSSGPI